MIFISIIFGNFKFSTISPNIFSISLSAYGIANSNTIGYENRSFSIINHPALQNIENDLIGYSLNSLFSNQASVSLIKFARKQKNNYSYKLGGIYFSIDDIPDTRDLFNDGNSQLPNYSKIDKYNFSQYFIWFNLFKKYSNKTNIGLNVLPHFLHLGENIGYGILFNGSIHKSINKYINYSIISNSIPGSMTLWNKKYHEFYPIELRNIVSFKFKKFIINSSLDYISESINILSRKFYDLDNLEYSLSIEFIVNKELQLIISKVRYKSYGSGFIFKYDGLELYYGIGFQSFDSVITIHQGIDLVFNMKKIDKWKNILNP